MLWIPHRNPLFCSRRRNGIPLRKGPKPIQVETSPPSNVLRHLLQTLRPTVPLFLPFFAFEIKGVSRENEDACVLGFFLMDIHSKGSTVIGHLPRSCPTLRTQVYQREYFHPVAHRGSEPCGYVCPSCCLNIPIHSDMLSSRCR